MNIWKLYRATIVSNHGSYEVWANEDGQYGIVDVFNNMKDAYKFVSENYK
jgi:hypothetical protein